MPSGVSSRPCGQMRTRPFWISNGTAVGLVDTLQLPNLRLHGIDDRTTRRPPADRSGTSPSSSKATPAATRPRSSSPPTRSSTTPPRNSGGVYLLTLAQLNAGYVNGHGYFGWSDPACAGTPLPPGTAHPAPPGGEATWRDGAVTVRASARIGQSEPRALGPLVPRQFRAPDVDWRRKPARRPGCAGPARGGRP